MAATDTIDLDCTELMYAQKEEAEYPVAYGPDGGSSKAAAIQWDRFDTEPGRHFRVLALVTQEDDLFISQTPSLPGAMSQGTSIEDALDQLREATAGCIASYQAAAQSIPWVRSPKVEQSECAYCGWIDVDV